MLLASAWRASPNDPDLSRTVTTSETREAVLEDKDALRIDSVWEVLDERVTTRRDGLIAQSTWLLNLNSGPQRFALLLDFFPAATGRRGGAFTPGEQFEGELVFYRAELPLRALIAERKPGNGSRTDWPSCAENTPLTGWQSALNAAPWTLAAPLLLPAGRLCRSSNGLVWWRSAQDEYCLPIASGVPAMAFGTQLDAAVAIWDGARCDLLAATSSQWGRVSFDA